MTRTSRYTNYNQQIIKKWLEAIDKNIELEEISPLSISDEKVKSSIVKFANILKKKFSPEKLIINKVKMADYYKSKDGGLIKFSSSWKIQEINLLLEKCSSWLIAELNGCHIIEMPENVLGNEAHKWGVSPLHYIDEYYSYGREAIQIILHSKSDQEEKLLENHREKYNLIFMNYMIDIAKKTVQKYNIKTMTKEIQKYKEYTHSLKRILCITNFEKKLNTFLKKRNIEHIALYGYTEITEVFIKKIKKIGIDIIYIVENSKINIKDKIIPKSSPTYPCADAILICDLVWENEIKEKLGRMIDFPIFTIGKLTEEIENETL